MSEAEFKRLIERVSEGDEAAFTDLYRRLESRVFNFIRSKLNDSFEAGDILNEVFLEVWRSAGRFEGRSKATTWIFGIAYYKTMDRLRRRNREILVEPQELDRADESPDQAEALAALEEGDHLRFCLDKLAPRQRAVVELAFFEDLSYQEIAKIVDCPEGTVKSRVYHAKEALRHCLAQRMGAER